MTDLVPGTANKAVREVIDGKEVFTPIVQSGGSVPTGGATEAKQDAIIALLTTANGLLEDIKTNTTPAA